MSKWKLIQPAQHYCVRNILRADGFLLMQVVDVLYLRYTDSIVWQQAVRIGDLLSPGIGGQQIQPITEAALERNQQRLIAGHAYVLQAATSVDKTVLRKWAKSLLHLSAIPQRVEARERLAHADGVACYLICEVIAEREVLLIDVVNVLDIGVEVLSFVPHISNRHDQILRYLLLQLQCPFADHCRTTILRFDVGATYRLSVEDTGI